MPLSEFITALSHQLDSITCYLDIAKSQARYLPELKQKLEEDAIIVSGEFAKKLCFCNPG